MFDLLSVTGVNQGSEGVLAAIGSLIAAIAAWAAVFVTLWSVRKKDELIFRVIDLRKSHDHTLYMFVSAPRPQTDIRLSISNSGNTQFVIDAIKITGTNATSSVGWQLIDIPGNLPFVIVPGQIVLVRVLYSPYFDRPLSHPDAFGWDEGVKVRITAHSAMGRRYEAQKEIVVLNGEVAVDRFKSFKTERSS